MHLLRSASLAITLGLALASALRAQPLNLETATIADLNAAFAAGTLTSEKLTQAYLARIAAYEDQGPVINSIITLNPEALATARALDAERKAGKVRGPLHGIPIFLKDNIDTFDLPTTGGSQLLAGSFPPDDAFITKKLRAAGAIILAKANTSEWAGGGGSVTGATDPEILKKGAVPNGSSSMGGQTLNPHDLARGPAGSSGGTGAGIAAVFAQFGLGSDTGGSVRGPSAANGIVGLKPTIGLLSRDGIIPLALSFDTAGPLTRHVYDMAVSLDVMAGVDRADAATRAARGKIPKTYTSALKTGSLKGARIGVARSFMGQDAGTDLVMESALATLRSLGAVVVDVPFPDFLLQSRASMFRAVMPSEFKAQIGGYLATLKPGFPRTFEDIVRLSNDPATKFRAPEKAFALTYTAEQALAMDDPVYLAAINEGMPFVRATITALMTRSKLDAIVYPTSPRPAVLIGGVAPTSVSATNFANLTGFPDLSIPAGMTPGGLPVTISFFGLAWSEAKLLGFGYDFEQATKARVLPKHTPALASDVLSAR